MSEIGEDESRRIRAQIRHLLLNIWDPIGVRNEPLAQDEYDRYLGDLCALLIRRASDAELIDYLHWVAHERMGFTSEASRAGASRAIAALKAVPLPAQST
jgi:hypothetical protein